MKRVFLVIEVEYLNEVAQNRVVSVHKTRASALKACKGTRHTRVDEYEVES